MVVTLQSFTGENLRAPSIRVPLLGSLRPRHPHREHGGPRVAFFGDLFWVVNFRQAASMALFCRNLAGVSLRLFQASLA